MRIFCPAIAALRPSGSYRWSRRSLRFSDPRVRACRTFAARTADHRRGWEMVPGGCRAFGGISWCGAAHDPSRTAAWSAATPAIPPEQTDYFVRQPGGLPNRVYGLWSVTAYGGEWD